MIPRASVGQQIPLPVTWYAPGAEDPTAPDVAPTPAVSVTHVNGTVVLASTAMSNVSSGAYTYTLAPQALPAILNVTFTATFGGVAVTKTDTVEITGAQMCELAELRALDALADRTKYPTPLLARKRDAAAAVFEQATGRRWVRSYARDVLDGDPSLRQANMATNLSTFYYNPVRRMVLSNLDPRQILSVSTNDGSGAILATDLTIFNTYSSGEVEKSLSSGPWPRGIDNVIIEYLYGKDAPPEDLRDQFTKYVRFLVLQTNSRIPDNATSMQSEQMSVTLGTAGPGKWTGIPSVDATLERYGYRLPVIA